jgi:ubiquinone/menaquinone biosynthesis C-methylase UbiE
MKEPGQNIVSTGYDAVFEATPRSPTLLRLWREHACGTDWPEGFDHISFVDLPQHRQMVRELRLSPGNTLVDLACGMAGPALLAARETGAKLVGVDFSAVAVRMATERAASLGMGNSTHFVNASFADTGLEAASADAAMSEDALQYVPDKTAAINETARILRPGGRLVFSAFELDPQRSAAIPVIGEDPVGDYRPLLQQAGFTVDTYEDATGWPDRVTAAYQSLLEARDSLMQEMGPVASTALMSELTLTLQTRMYRRRVLMVATKR